MAYFSIGGISDVYCFKNISKQWTKLPKNPTVGFAFVVIGDLLTTVGGIESNKLFTFTKGKWVEKFPPMLTNRWSPAAVCTGHSLVVAGGKDEHIQVLPTVEVMDTKTLQWFTAASLSRGVSLASMTMCRDNFYLLHPGGANTTDVYSCSLQALLQSCQAPRKASTSQEASIWKKITDLPVSESTAVTLCDQLVSVGGGCVYHYDPLTSMWKTIGQLPSCISNFLATTLQGDKLIFVHGRGDITIEVASATVS